MRGLDPYDLVKIMETITTDHEARVSTQLLVGEYISLLTKQYFKRNQQQKAKRRVEKIINGLLPKLKKTNTKTGVRMLKFLRDMGVDPKKQK